MTNSQTVPISVVIPTRNTRELTLCCLSSLPADSDLDIVVIDDASDDGTAQAIRFRHPWVRLLRSEVQLGFTTTVNRGLRRAKGRTLLLLNSDTELLPESLAVVRAAFAEAPLLGVAGARLHYPDGTAQWSGGREPDLLWSFALASGLPVGLAQLPGYRRLRPPTGSGAGEVEWVTGAAMAIRREVWEEVGPLDESFQFYCQDLDFCLRTHQAGWQVRILPDFHVLHHHGATIVQRERGSVGHKAPELLWSDLVRWAEKHRGTSAARRIAAALKLGGKFRVLASLLLAPLLPKPAREALRRDRIIYRHALRVVHSLPLGGDSSRPSISP